MSALLRTAAAIAVTWALSFGAAAAEAHPSPSPMVDQINQIRVGFGLRSLHYTPILARSSARYARYMMRSGHFTHASRIWASDRFSKLGEVLALTPGWNINRTRTIIFWLLSPSHRAVLLSPSFRYIGAARTRGYLQGGEAILWAVQLGTAARRKASH